MIQIELKTPLGNCQFRPDLVQNCFINAGSFVFTVIDPKPRKRTVQLESGATLQNWQFRARLSVPSRAVSVRKLKPRRIRAEIVWGALKQFRAQSGPVSWKQIDDAYLAVLATDGCDRVWLAFRKTDLYLDGFVRKLHRYWRVPDAPQKRLVQKDDQPEHPDGDQSGQAAQAGGSECVLDGVEESPKA